MSETYQQKDISNIPLPEELIHIFSQLRPQEIEQFYKGYQYWSLLQHINRLRLQITAIEQGIDANNELLRQVQPSAPAISILAQLSSLGVEDIDVLDSMLERGDEWLDHAMQLLEQCERLDVIQGNYTEWCEHAMEGAYDWINSIDEEAPAGEEHVQDPSAQDTAALLLQKLTSGLDEETMKTPSVHLASTNTTTPETAPSSELPSAAVTTETTLPEQDISMQAPGGEEQDHSADETATSFTTAEASDTTTQASTTAAVDQTPEHMDPSAAQLQETGADFVAQSTEAVDQLLPQATVTQESTVAIENSSSHGENQEEQSPSIKIDEAATIPAMSETQVWLLQQNFPIVPALPPSLLPVDQDIQLEARDAAPDALSATLEPVETTDILYDNDPFGAFQDTMLENGEMLDSDTPGAEVTSEASTSLTTTGISDTVLEDSTGIPDTISVSDDISQEEDTPSLEDKARAETHQPTSVPTQITAPNDNVSSEQPVSDTQADAETLESKEEHISAQTTPVEATSEQQKAGTESAALKPVKKKKSRIRNFFSRLFRWFRRKPRSV